MPSERHLLLAGQDSEGGKFQPKLVVKKEEFKSDLGLKGWLERDGLKGRGKRKEKEYKCLDASRTRR